MSTTTTTVASTTTRLLNPRTYDAAGFDPATRKLFRATIDWFEAKGKARLTSEVRTDVWYADFIEFLARERAFATLLTPAREAGSDPNKRWDTARNAVFNEILGFFGLTYWYAWQVTILGLGPIWQSDNDVARMRAAQLLEDGAVFAFGLPSLLTFGETCTIEESMTLRARTESAGHVGDEHEWSWCWSCG